MTGPRSCRLAWSLAAILSAAIIVPLGAQTRSDAPVIVGELRLFAVDPGNRDALDALHRAGWIEADGRILKRDDFMPLYERIGRAWTSAKAAADVFAVPDLVDRHKGPNPYGVLGPGDLVSGGREMPLPPSPAYFIYVGRDAGDVPVVRGAVQTRTRR